jgi:hypothetical protein
MKKLGQVAILGLLMGVSAGMAHSQVVAGVSARIPFKFSVSGKTFEAGDYRMTVGSQQVSVVSLSDGRTLAIALANQVSANQVSEKDAGKFGRIVFRCYREQCFLAQVWSPTADRGRQLMVTGDEKKAAQKEEGTYFAVLGRAAEK